MASATPGSRPAERVKPCRRALWEERIFPADVVGPVLFFTFFAARSLTVDGEGNRTSQSVGGVTTNFTFNSDDQLTATARESLGQGRPVPLAGG